MESGIGKDTMINGKTFIYGWTKKLPKTNPL